MQRNIVLLQDVTHEYDSDSPALAHVSLVVPEKSFILLTGPSGAGKSTLLRIIRGELVPSEGLVELFGFDRRKMNTDQLTDVRQAIGVVFQEPHFLNNSSVYENVKFVLDVDDVSSVTAEDDTMAVLDLVGLSAYAKRKPHELSGGQRQLLQIARGCVRRPMMVIADEPVAHLDPESAQKVVEVFARLQELGTTIVVTTHQSQFFDKLPQIKRVSVNKGTVSEATTNRVV